MKVLFESENSRLEIGVNENNNLVIEVSDGMTGTGLEFDGEESELIHGCITAYVQEIKAKRRAKLSWWKRLLS